MTSGFLLSAEKVCIQYMHKVTYGDRQDGEHHGRMDFSFEKYLAHQFSFKYRFM